MNFVTCFRLYRFVNEFNFCSRRITLASANGMKSNVACTSGIVGMSTRPLEKTINSRHVADHRIKWYEGNCDSASQALIQFKYLRLIKVAIRENGPIFEENPKLAGVVEAAKNNDIPPDFIEYAMNISIDTRANVGLHEILLPGGCHFIIQYEDIDSAFTKHHLLKICQRSDATFVYSDVKWPQHFDQKGIVSLSCKNDIDDKKIEDIAMKCGADTVKREFDEEGCEYWKFYCNSSALHEVKRYLRNISQVEESYIGYIPRKAITASKNIKNAASDIIVDLSKLPQIDRVYDNLS